MASAMVCCTTDGYFFNKHPIAYVVSSIFHLFWVLENEPGEIREAGSVEDLVPVMPGVVLKLQTFQGPEPWQSLGAITHLSGINIVITIVDNFSTKIRVARWCIFIPKMPIRVYFGKPWDGKFWCTSWPIWYISRLIWYWPFSTFVATLVYFPGLDLSHQEKSCNAYKNWRIYQTNEFF
jgi:hypothetical protein